MRRTSLSLATAAAAAAMSVPFSTASADAGKTDPTSYVFGVIGDVPYGADQVKKFPGWVDQISADADVRFVTHVGDIKSGSSVRADEYFDFIRGEFDRFDTPLVFTPGDNEWTDCHRPNNGAYDPYERLDALRAQFAAMQAAAVRRTFYDGRLGDLTSGMPSTLMAMVSDNWTRHFTWRGVGPMPEAERAKLRSIVATAHANGYDVRFWATPDTPGDARTAIWTELLAAKVDAINTDDLPGLQAFLLAEDMAEAPAA